MGHGHAEFLGSEVAVHLVRAAVVLLQHGVGLCPDGQHNIVLIEPAFAPDLLGDPDVGFQLTGIPGHGCLPDPAVIVPQCFLDGSVVGIVGFVIVPEPLHIGIIPGNHGFIQPVCA